MQIDSINLNNLRVFECVYKTRCMTTASKELHLTQSGVSQHVKSLEETLEVKLFDRINKKIYPTSEGDELYKVIQPALFNIEGALSAVTNREAEMKGRVNIGMPIEFGNNRIVPILGQLGQEFPELQFNLTMDFANKINDELLNGHLDFAFVDDFNMDKRIHVEEVSEEIHDLVATEKFLKRFGKKPGSTKSYFESLEYVAYQEGEPVLRSWFSHHLKRKNLTLNVRAQ
ncbi:MAG: LysR family transcriptional regulator, partial [Bdellovibrionales bacterium]|nr:LysR family transcriptional regulator [Bdellovibrionales bacterium]